MSNTKDAYKILKAISEGSEKWKAAFNAGDADGCANQYEVNAVMHARPFGTFNGITDIKTFWQNLINDGYADVEYINPRIEALDETSAVITSKWSMNKASGVIHKELWILQSDGTAKMREDDFEAIG